MSVSTSMYRERTILALFFTCQQEEAEFLCVGSKRKPSDRLIKGIVRERIFVTTITYCFCSNRTIVYCINKEEKRTHQWNEWFQMNRWITTRFGTDSVIQWFIWNHPFHRWERKEGDVDISDQITLYSVDKWDDLFFIDNEGRWRTISSTVLIWIG
jgi:hypothetical protein